jgi:hypothetical protein
VVVKGEHTEVRNLTVLELAAVERAINGTRQYLLYWGETTWTKRDRSFLDRLRRIRGVTVLEGRKVTIAGSLLPNGLTLDM